MNDVIPLISVIVPIYNVAPYLRKCLDSLKNQTMKQIEVICIDDGSTDSSGNIAEEYKSQNWPKFRVIHTENRGLSAARNRGLDEAIADWIMFVDSDDWVDERFCEIPYKASVDNQADMVIFDCDHWKKGKRLKSTSTAVLPVGVIDEFTAHEFGGVAVWNKLYKKAFFDTIRFPEGRVCEDVATTHKLVHAAKIIVSISDCLYHKTFRKGSICHTYTVENKRDSFESAIERRRSLISWGYPEEKVVPLVCGCAISFLSVTPPSTDDLYLYAVKVVDSVDGIPKGTTWKQKVGMIAWRVDRRVFCMISRVVGRMDTSSKSGFQ